MHWTKCHITARKRVYYVNTTTYGSVSWQSIHSFDSDSEDALNEWKNRKHEIFSRRCAMVRSIQWTGTEVKNPLVYDGISNLEDFLGTMEQIIVE